MPDIFVDTAGWGHLLDPSQAFHNEASAIYRRARQEGTRFLTTNYILAELVALLTSPLNVPRPKVIAFIAGLRSSPQVEIVHVDQTLDMQGWRLLSERPDKDWSLVDCASFVVMRQFGILEVCDRRNSHSRSAALLEWAFRGALPRADRLARRTDRSRGPCREGEERESTSRS